MTEDQTQHLVEYTRRYHAALEHEIEATERESLPHHGERTEIIAVIRASDAYATFYLPPPADPNIPRGFFLYDLSAYDLNRVCQSVSVHRLQIAPPMLGKHWSETPPIYAQADAIPEFSAPWIHDDIRAAAASGHLTNLPGMTVSPIVHVEAGIRQYIVPARIKIWAPVFPIPGVGLRRLYLWTHADFWWFPEQLDVDLDKAKDAARSDILAFQTLTAAFPTLTTAVANRDTPTHAADILNSHCDELIALLERDGDKEEVIHQWLKDDRHRVFLDPHAQKVWSKLPFGGKESDFVVRRGDGTYKLIEIERADKRIFRPSDSEPSQPFNHACQQVRDWKRYIRDNVQTVRNELGLTNIDDPDGMVVMGRSADIVAGAAETRWRDLKATSWLDLQTYDELCSSARALAEALRHLLKGVEQ